MNEPLYTPIQIRLDSRQKQFFLASLIYAIIFYNLSKRPFYLLDAFEVLEIRNIWILLRSDRSESAMKGFA